MDIKKIIEVTSHLSQVYSLSCGDVLYALECLIGKTFNASFPAVIRMDGKIIIINEKGVRCVLPGAKSLQKAFKGLDEQLRKASFQKDNEARFDKESLVYGRIEKKIGTGVFEVTLFDGLVFGTEVSQKIVKGVFKSNRLGNRGENYEVGRHYLFCKHSTKGNTIFLSRKNKKIIKKHLADVVEKIAKNLNIKIPIRVIHVELESQSVFVRHHSGVAHLIPAISKKIMEKCAFTVFATPENSF